MIYSILPPIHFVMLLLYDVFGLLCLRFPLTFPWITQFTSSHQPSLIVCPKKESLRRTTNTRSCLVVLSSVRTLWSVRCSVQLTLSTPHICDNQCIFTYTQWLKCEGFSNQITAHLLCIIKPVWLRYILLLLSAFPIRGRHSGFSFSSFSYQLYPPPSLQSQPCPLSPHP